MSAEQAGRVVGLSSRAPRSGNQCLVVRDELDEQLKTRGLLPADRGLVGDRLVSDTGQIVRDWGRALLTVDTPRTQAMTGFPGSPLALFSRRRGKSVQSINHDSREDGNGFFAHGGGNRPRRQSMNGLCD